MPTVTSCQQCGSEFQPKRSTQRYCSQACRNAAMEKWVDLVCQQCGKTFQRRPWQATRDGEPIRYCSTACYAAARVGQSRGGYVEPTERHCEACDRVFYVGGRGRPPKATRFCGIKCQQQARYRHGKRAEALTPTDAAYLAGFIDGEGSIMVLNHRGVAAIRITAANTYADVLSWLADVTGVGAVIWKKGANPKHKIGGQWACNSEAAESVIKQIRPYLKIKAAQADLALETQERLRDPALKADRSWQTEYIERSQTMNRRGPAVSMTATSGG